MGFPAARTPGPCILRPSGAAAVSERWVHLSLEMPQLLLLQLFPQAVSEGLQGSQQKAWASPCLCSFWFPRHESFFFSLLHSLPPLQPLRSREWVGDAGGGKASCSTGDWSNQCLQVLCGCCAWEGEELHSFQSFPEPPHPSQALWCCFLLTPPIKAEHHGSPPLPNFPILTMAVLSQGPTDPSQPHFLLLKSLCPPSPEEGSPTVPAWTYVGCWGEIFELATRSTTSTPGKPWAKSEHCSDPQCSGGQSKTTPGLGSALIFAHPGQEHTSVLLPATGDMCKWWRELTRGDSPVTVLSLPS